MTRIQVEWEKNVAKKRPKFLDLNKSIYGNLMMVHVVVWFQAREIPHCYPSCPKNIALKSGQK